MVLVVTVATSRKSNPSLRAAVTPMFNGHALKQYSVLSGRVTKVTNMEKSIWINDAQTGEAGESAALLCAQQIVRKW
jgi:hypothetical protein